MNELSHNFDHKIEELNNQLKSILVNQYPLVTMQQDKNIIRDIKKETAKQNKNNITRTNAYLRFYLEFPEVHWAFLAHMVSRNGGYNMTDLKSSLFGSFLEDHQIATLFQFLERANALIFHDAYPQLLLYKKSKEEGMSYFHLLPAFHITKFMIPIWEYFFQSKNSMVLTHALITNEQQYVETNLMSLEFTKASVFKTFSYLLQEKLGFTHVLFPYKRYAFLPKYSLAGLEIHDFDSVLTRIDTGKKLYKILFSKHWYSSFLKFATIQDHTASRHDYWPHFFSKIAIHNHQKIHSPPLHYVWKDVNHHFHRYKDWYKDFTQIKHFNEESHIDFQDITKDVKQDLKVMKTLANVKNLVR